MQVKQQKTDKTEESEGKRHKNKAFKEHKAVVNGKEDSEGSGTMTFSYKKLHVPKELIKKVKKLVETTTGLNNTFIQFIQQTAEEQGDKSIRYRHLKAFKAVLADLKKAHTALEEALIPEFRNTEVQNGTVENDSMENVVDAADAVEGMEKEREEEPDEVKEEQLEKPDEELYEQRDEEQHEHPQEDNEQGLNEDKASADTDSKDSPTETAATKKIIQSEVCDDELLPTDEISLDHDIMSVPPSVPEELFQMVESLSDSTMLLQNDTNSVSDTGKNTENVESNIISTVGQHPQPKVKNLIVKLTPVPVVTTRGSRLSSRKNEEEDKEIKNTFKKETSEKGEQSSPPPSRRSSRVKTTPLRKQAENMGKEESSESELEEERKRKTKSSKKCNNAENEEEKKMRMADSDSDEVPDILLEKAAAGHSTDEEQGSTSVKTRLFRSNSTSAQDTERASKRKRKSASSDSDLENKSKKMSKKKKQNDSDSSTSESDQERKSKSKVSTAKRRSGGVKKNEGATEEDGNSPDGKAAKQRRSYEKKCKRRSSKSASKLESSPSEDEEELQEGGDSGEDSDVQKIKPIVEDNMVGAGAAFHQSSGN